MLLEQERPGPTVSAYRESQRMRGGSFKLGLLYGSAIVREVEHIHAYRYYLLGCYVHDLLVVEQGIRITAEVVHVVISGMDALMQFAKNEDQTALRSSIESANSLIEILRTTFNSFVPAEGQVPRQATFSLEEQNAVSDAVKHFQTMLEKELGDLPLFCVEDKGNLDMRKLLNGASQGYPQNTRAKLSQPVLEEIDESGRCLAFTRPTASGFHVLRSLELVIKIYIGSNSLLQMPAPNRCNWGEYIQILRNGNCPKEITDLLQIVKDNYRNPIMHPEQTLTLDEAISLFNICGSAIEVVCRHIP